MFSSVAKDCGIVAVTTTLIIGALLSGVWYGRFESQCEIDTMSSRIHQLETENRLGGGAEILPVVPRVSAD